MGHQGQGRHTARKIELLKASLAQNLSVVKHAIRAPAYFHFDLNAGSGFNEKAGCIGSPLAFREAANKAGMPEALCFCCELNKEHAMQLQTATANDLRTFVTLGRNQDFVEQIPDIISQYGVEPASAYGTVLIDPNDQRRDAIPYDGLRLVAKQCPKLDVIFHFPQLAMKRIASGIQKGTCPVAAGKDCFDIDELPEVIGKKHLWIRQTPEMGNFAIVIGRNTPNVNTDKQAGMEHWESVLGIYYRERCKLPVQEAERRHQHRMAERNGQKLLFY